ncbi:MAG: DUF1045 domain-containing protein, partial [Granulosicoccus sp.]|nr:DUF1045 domain-containing protein [Granulosicoccus sp.]
MSMRHAIYFSPADTSALAAFGKAVLGRSNTTARPVDAGSTFPDRQRWLTLTRSPAHYGFHATLKAPFELQEDYTVQSLAEHLQQFACRQSRIQLHSLAPRQMAGFSALTLVRQPAQLRSLAMQIVTEFEPYRRALTEADIERRMAQPLSTRQLELLRSYGYPYVDDEFRFHMTLSGPIGEQDTDYL